MRADWPASSSPSTATPRRWSDLSRRRPSSPTASRSSSCWRPPASTSPWWCPSTRRGPTRRPRSSSSKSSSARSVPAWWWWGRTSTSVTGAPATWRCSPRWGHGTGSTCSVCPWRRTRPRRRCPPRASVSCSPPATWRRRQNCSDVRTRSGDWSCTVTVGEARSSASRPPTWRCPTAWPCPARGSTPAGTSGPTGRSTPRPPPWDAAPPSTPRPTRPCSRCSCWTSAATSTARWPGCRSWPTCATSVASTPPRRSSGR